jgi:type VI protein secretion system component Hcp
MKMMQLLAVGTLVAGAAASASSDRGNDRRNPPATIIVAVDGLSCTTALGAGTFAAYSWSWGAANETTSTGGGGGVGRATVADLTIKKVFDACSPILFGAVVDGRHFRSLTLTQRDGAGVVVATLEMSEVFIASWNVGSSVRDAAPTETVAVEATNVCLTSAGSPRVCYDLRRA